MASERDRILARYRSAIVGGMARTLWVHAYVTWAGEDEENDPDGVSEAMAGVDWADLAPDTPDAALQAANELAELYETGTDNGSIVDLYGSAIHTDTRRELEMDDLIGAGRPEALPGEFGSALANMALSTGSSWFDDHKKFPLARPSFECNYDGVQFSWSGRSETLHRHGVEVPDMNARADGLRIRVSYEIISPESAEDGDVAERGWDNEEGVPIEDVREAVEYLTENGPLEPSSSSFHHSIWYTHYGERDYRTGNVRTVSFHITGATMSQEQRIFDGLMKARALCGHFSGARDPRNRNRPRQNPSRAELRDVGFVQTSIKSSIDSEFKQKVDAIVLKPGPLGKVPSEESFKRDLAANLTMGVLLDDEGEECGCEHKNPPGRFTEKGERMFEDVKLEYERKGNPRAAELAARTVYAKAKEGVPGLLNVGAGRPPGVPNPGRFRRL